MYTPRQRVGDVIAVLDRIGGGRVHVIGYSMGGWITAAMLVYASERLLSLCVGGWDPVRGMAGVRERLGLDLDFDMVMGGFRSTYPQLTAWITPDREPALRCCFSAVDDLNGVEYALDACELPILLWDGVADPHHGGSRELAAQLRTAEFVETPGDHAAAFFDEASEAVTALRAFLHGTSQTRPRRSPAPT